MSLSRYLLCKYFVSWAYLLATNMPFVHAENDFHAVENLVQTACISCHDAETETNVNLNAIDKPDAFHQWVLKQIDSDQALEPSIHRVHANIIVSFHYFTQQQLFEMYS